MFFWFVVSCNLIPKITIILLLINDFLPNMDCLNIAVYLAANIYQLLPLFSYTKVLDIVIVV